MTVNPNLGFLYYTLYNTDESRGDSHGLVKTLKPVKIHKT